MTKVYIPPTFSKYLPLCFQTGKRMHYELGEFTRARYGSFFPTEYSPYWFRAQTTDVDRTHMSCQANLAGLFKPTEDEIWNKHLCWQPIPVHPADTRVLLYSPNCPIYYAELANILKNEVLFKKIDEDYADLYQYLTKHTGLNVTTVLHIFALYDTLHIEDQLGFELPSWTEEVYPEPMKTLTGYAFLALAFTTEQKRLGMYEQSSNVTSKSL